MENTFRMGSQRTERTMVHAQSDRADGNTLSEEAAVCVGFITRARLGSHI